MNLDLLKEIKDLDSISISYLQRNHSMGYVLATKVFKELVDTGVISSDGSVNKERICQELGETYERGVKIVFLDIDGVLNCETTKECCGPYIGIDDNKVSLLKQIVDQTGAKIVLVSSWKLWWTNNPRHKKYQDELANYLDEKFRKQGLSIVDKTNEYSPYNRGDGILEYLRYVKHMGITVDKFIIIDDEMFDYKQTKLTPNLIQTSFYKQGLETKHVKRAIDKLI